MTEGMELYPEPGLQAAQRLLDVAERAAGALAAMRPMLEAPAALSVGDQTAEDILRWYRPNAENLGQVMDVAASNADALGQDARQLIRSQQGNDQDTAARLRALARQAPGAQRSGDARA